MNFRTFFPKPHAVPSKDYNIYYILSLISSIACLVTIALLPLAFFSGSKELALFAVLPITAAGVVTYFNVKGEHFISVILIFSLTYIFTIVTTLYFGWSAGFQYYLIAGIAIFILYPYLSNKILFAMSLIYTLTFVILYLSLSLTPAESFRVTFILHSINAIISITLVCATNLYFRTNTEFLIKKISHRANSDVLTDLPNRRSMNSALLSFTNEIKTHSQPLALLLIDIDLFKNINRSYGHDNGDRIMQEFAKLLKASLRETDLVGRWGGDEFLILAPFTFSKEAIQLAENLRQKIEDYHFILSEYNVKLTITCSIAEIKNTHSLKTALNQIDALLTQGKQQGRNQVVFIPKENQYSEIL